MRITEEKMVQFKKYTTQSGEIRYQFQTYLGKDPHTGKDKVTRRRGFKTKSAARIAYSRLKVEFFDKGEIKHNEKITFQQLFDEWWKIYVTTVRKSTTIRTACYFRNQILPDFKDYYVDKITTKDCQEFIIKWFESGYKSYNSAFKYLKKILEYARKQHYIDANPCEDVIKPQQQKPLHPKKNYWTKEELEEFLNAINKQKEFQQYTYFRLLAFTGIRKGESFALYWSDVDFKNGILNISKTLAQGKNGKMIEQLPKTQAGIRKIPLDKKTLETLSEWKKKQVSYFEFLNNKYCKIKPDNQQLIFTNTHNHYLINYTPKEWMDQILKRVDIPRITIHGLRHTHASLLYASGVDIKEAQLRLGHSDLNTTMQIYTHVGDQQEKMAVNKLVNYVDF